MSSPAFEAYCRRKTDAAVAARMAGFTTVLSDEAASAGLERLGNAFTRGRFDGWFFRSPSAEAGLPAVTLVFVQSKDGNTGARDPSTLGGGETDKHLIYEGLSRVDADGVLAGATTAREDELVFSVWHPELVALRTERGRPRHPAQIVVTDRGDLPLHRALMFNEPTLRVIIVTGPVGAAVLQRRLVGRPWIEVIDAGQPVGFRSALRELSARGMRSISSVGGRRTASALLRAGVVRDLYLTTAPRPGGEPGTPFYEGPPLNTRVVVEKSGRGVEAGVVFQHLAL